MTFNANFAPLFFDVSLIINYTKAGALVISDLQDINQWEDIEAVPETND
jgi:hypothetical protein